MKFRVKPEDFDGFGPHTFVLAHHVNKLIEQHEAGLKRVYTEEPDRQDVDWHTIPGAPLPGEKGRTALIYDVKPIEENK